jgi:acetolactate synthase-1/3 small subunit
MKHTISVLVENKFGVLSRVSGLFSGRGYNIESISASETLDPNTSMITLVTSGDEWILEQIIKQLNKLIDVIKLVDYAEVEHVEREMILIKVAPRKEDRVEVMRTIDIFRGRIIDSSRETYTIEVTGEAKKIEAFIELMRPLGIKEFVRTGKVAMARELPKKTKAPEVK